MGKERFAALAACIAATACFIRAWGICEDGEGVQLLQMKAPCQGLKPDPGTPGWLIERMFHHEPVWCPWQAAGSAPDADCKSRYARIKALRDKIAVCQQPLRKTMKSIGHRGAPLVAPEETVASWKIGAASGAGYLECDASVTADLDLICRHSNCDLAFTTDLVTNHPDLNSKCTVPFVPGSGVEATCCTFDFTMAELDRLCAIMESIVNASAGSYSGYVLGPPGFRTGAIAKEKCHGLVPYRDYLKLLKEGGYSAIPELKDTWEKRTEDFLTSRGRDIFWLADSFADMLAEHGFKPWPDGNAAESGLYGIMQTFDYRIARYWKETRGKSATVEYMWQSIPQPGANCSDANGYYGGPNGPGGDCGGETLLQYLNDLGVDMFSPPMQLLLSSGAGRTVVPSATALMLKKLEVRSIGSWSMDRQGCTPKPGPPFEQPVTAELPEQFLAPCWDPSAFYYSTTDGNSTWQHVDVLIILDVLFNDVGIASLFSDYPLTVSTYVNCILEA